jgi:hypothetical protein
MRAEEMQFPLRHPPQLERDAAADLITEENAFSGKEFLKPLFEAMRRHTRSQR